MRLIEDLEGLVKLGRFPAAWCVKYWAEADIKAACKVLRERHPELKVKRIKECGEPFVRFSVKKD